jgi:hypothetical protein
MKKIPPSTYLLTSHHMIISLMRYFRLPNFISITVSKPPYEVFKGVSYLSYPIIPYHITIPFYILSRSNTNQIGILKCE